MDFNLTEFLEGVKPNILTPKLTEIVQVSNAKKPKVIADIIMKGIHKSLGDTVTKDILHDGVIHKVRYFDIEPLMRGPWSQISLMILQLSYGEQCSIIESIYPKELQLSAKALAINFTSNTERTVYVENDKEIVEKLNTANLGIATLMTMLTSIGGVASHVDTVKNNLNLLQQMQKDNSELQRYKTNLTKAEQANKHNDMLRK